VTPEQPTETIGGVPDELSRIDGVLGRVDRDRFDTAHAQQVGHKAVQAIGLVAHEPRRSARMAS
jgi:hypothetical protein